MQLKADPRIEKIIVTEKEIEQACTRAVEWINKTYENKNFLMVGVLKGCIPFIGKIIDRIKPDMKLDFMTVSSFQSGGITRDEENHPKIVMDLITDIKGLHVLIVEDIIDTGNSLKAIVDILKMRKPKDIKICCLLDRKCQRRVNLDPDFSGVILPQGFNVGFGLDFLGYMRNLPYVATLTDESIRLGHKIFEKK